jgi:hypothetical protein
MKMRGKLRFAKAVLVVASFCLTSSQREIAYTVSGVVTDAGGSALASASVAAIPVEEGASAGDFRWVRVDDQGKFRLALTPGRYVVRAKAEADGYPDPSFLLCADANSRFPEISVDRADVPDVHVLLGTRGGVLAGDLRDEITQQAVPRGKVTIRDARRRDAFVQVSADDRGHFQFTVPSKPIQLTAAAPGYRVTNYEDGAELVLSGGEHRTLTIGLGRK